MTHMTRYFAVRYAVMGVLLFIVAFSILSYHLGSPSAAVTYIRGESFFFSPEIVEFGECYPGAKLERHVKFTNLADNPVRIVGCMKDCSCILTEEFPIIIGPREDRDLSIRPDFTQLPTGNHSLVLIYYVDDGKIHSVVTRVRFRLMPDSPSAHAVPKSTGSPFQQIHT